MSDLNPKLVFKRPNFNSSSSKNYNSFEDQLSEYRNRQKENRPKAFPNPPKSSFFTTMFHDTPKESESTPLLTAEERRNLKQKEDIFQAAKEQRQKDQIIVQERGAIIQERTENIQDIANELEQVKEIMEDLNRLTNEQTPYLDTIESQIEFAEVKTEEGTKQLKKASKHQKGKRKILVYTAAGGVTVIGAIFIGLAAAKKSIFG